MKRSVRTTLCLRTGALTAVIIGLLGSVAFADLDLNALAQRTPKARVLVEVTFHGPIAANHVRSFRKLGLQPIATNTTALIGREKLMFQSRADAAAKLAEGNEVVEVRWIKQYPVATHCHAYFEYAGDEPAPELTFTMATPRSAAGRTLTSLHCFASPETAFTTATDAAGNEFLTVKLADVQPRQQVLFDFYATYDYDTETIVAGSMAMLNATPMPDTWPEELRPFLQPGFHTESDAPEILEAAKALTTSDRLDERARAVMAYVGKSVKYDHDKRERYFGGRYVYNNSWEMWQGALGTLKRGIGCCPDTAELKVALLRAVGIPARTAVHSGHLYAELYVPDRGWLTDAPMYNIPLIRSPGADNCAYFSWEPELPVRCVEWGGQTQPFGQLRAGMTMDHPH